MTARILQKIAQSMYGIPTANFARQDIGDKWTLVHPVWIDAKCGVSGKLRWHGKVAFALLFVGVGLFLLGK